MSLTYDKVVQILKSKNYRLTDIRLAIIKIVLEKQHLTLNEIVEKLEEQFESVNLTSVYNSLNLLLNEHILFTNTFDSKQIWYDVVQNPSFHLICDMCKKIIHIEDANILAQIDLEGLSKSVEQLTWLPVHFKIEGHGFCPNCQKTGIHHNHFEDDLD